jgi:hypothetical protein
MSNVVTLVVSTRLRRSLLRRMDLRRFWHSCSQGYHQRCFFLSLIPTVMTTSKMRPKPIRFNVLERSQRVTTEVTTSAAAVFPEKERRGAGVAAPLVTR